MFKEMIDMWRGKVTLFDQISRDFEEMISTAHHMFDLVTDALLKGEMREDLKKEVYKLDAQINNKEQTIRRQVMTLLAGGTEGPIAACMVLISISKDAERLGDYAKNILEVFEVKPHLNRSSAYYEGFVTLKSEISSLFKGVSKAYHTSDKELARRLYKEAFEQQKRCDRTVRALLLAAPEEDRVAHAVLTRFAKRILAHLSNIATGIFMPITKIDFFDERLRDEELKK